MHSYYSRVNNVFFTAVYSLAGVAAIYGIISFFTPLKGELIRLENGKATEMLTDRKERYLFPMLELDLSYDLRKDWNYNVRSMYVYVLVSFEGKKEHHDMIMWDKIIMSPEDSVFDEHIKNKYLLFNDDEAILNTELSISVHYDMQPIVGVIQRHDFEKVLKIQTSFNS